MMPIYFLWIHEGFEDRWRLAYDGSLWGAHDVLIGCGNAKKWIKELKEKAF